MDAVVGMRFVTAIFLNIIDYIYTMGGLRHDISSIYSQTLHTTEGV